MKRTVAISLFSAALALGAISAHAEPTSYHIAGEQLLTYCQDTINMLNGKEYNVSKSSWCIGFIQGAVTAHRFYSAYYTVQNPKNKGLSDAVLEKRIAEYQVYCVPTSVTLGSLVRDVVKFLKDEPKYQKDPASLVVARALYQSYPCRATAP